MPVDYAAEYTRLHKVAKYFRGGSIRAHLDAIGELVRKHEAANLLDYGCGKADQYLKNRAHEAWGVEMPRLYDIGVPAISKKPSGVFDGVICTDVLEHIEETDVPGVLQELVGFAGRFLFLAISCAPERKKKGKTLSDGRGLHLTVKPPAWWDEQISIASAGADIEIITRYMDL